MHFGSAVSQFVVHVIMATFRMNTQAMEEKEFVFATSLQIGVRDEYAMQQIKTLDRFRRKVWC